MFSKRQRIKRMKAIKQAQSDKDELKQLVLSKINDFPDIEEEHIYRITKNIIPLYEMDKQGKKLELNDYGNYYFDIFAKIKNILQRRYELNQLTNFSYLKDNIQEFHIKKLKEEDKWQVAFPFRSKRMKENEASLIHTVIILNDFNDLKYGYNYEYSENDVIAMITVDPLDFKRRIDHISKHGHLVTFSIKHNGSNYFASFKLQYILDLFDALQEKIEDVELLITEYLEEGEYEINTSWNEVKIFNCVLKIKYKTTTALVAQRIILDSGDLSNNIIEII